MSPRPHRGALPWTKAAVLAAAAHGALLLLPLPDRVPPPASPRPAVHLARAPLPQSDQIDQSTTHPMARSEVPAASPWARPEVPATSPAVPSEVPATSPAATSRTPFEVPATSPAVPSEVPATSRTDQIVRKTTQYTNKYDHIDPNVGAIAFPGGVPATSHQVPATSHRQVPRQVPATSTGQVPATSTASTATASVVPQFDQSDRPIGGLAPLTPVEPPPPPTPWDPHAYGVRVRQRIDAHKRYPARARRQALEGESVIAVTVRPDGHLAAPPRLVRSSGVSALDREALRMARAAAPYPPPAALRPLTLEVPIHFSLSEL